MKHLSDCDTWKQRDMPAVFRYGFFVWGIFFYGSGCAPYGRDNEILGHDRASDTCGEIKYSDMVSRQPDEEGMICCNYSAQKKQPPAARCATLKAGCECKSHPPLK